MRVHVVHDTHGNIEGIVVSPPDSPALIPAAPPGLRVSEIEPPTELTVDGSSDELARVVERYRVEPASPTVASLVAKTAD